MYKADEDIHKLHITCLNLPRVIFIDTESSVDFTTDLINNRTDILRGHNVHIYTRIVNRVSFGFCMEV